MLLQKTNRCIFAVLLLTSALWCLRAEANGFDRHKYVISSHPRIFITPANKKALQNKATGPLVEIYTWLIQRVNHKKIPVRLEELRDYIYKYGYLYQMSGDPQWADLVFQAMAQIPSSLEAYGGADNGYAFALEGVSAGFDWCYDLIEQNGKKQHYISMINEYYLGNEKNFEVTQDFHNYAAQMEFAMLMAGLATYGDNPKALSYLDTASNIMEKGELRKDGVVFRVKDSIDYVDGACNWEGATYGRKQTFAYVKYAEAWRTSTNEKINPWKDAFSKLENAGYYRIYSLRPDKLSRTWEMSITER